MLHCPAVVGLSGNDEIAPAKAIHTYLKAWSHHTTTAATAPAIGATTTTITSTKQLLPILCDTTATDGQADVTSSLMEVLWWEHFCHGRALFHKASLHDFMKRLDDQAEVFKLNLPHTSTTVATITTAVVVASDEEYIELQQIEVKSSHGMSLDLHDDIDDDWIHLASAGTANSVTPDTATAAVTAACTPTRDDSSIGSNSVHDTRTAAAAAVALHDDWQSDNCQENDSSSEQQYCKCEHATSYAADDSLCGGSCMKSGDEFSGAVSKQQRVNRDRSRSRTRQVTTFVSPVRQGVSAQ
jgi:hypothetical protein